MRRFFVLRFLKYNLLLSAIAVLVVSVFLSPTAAGLLQALGWNLVTAGYGISAVLYHRQHRREFLFLFNFRIPRRQIYGLAWGGSGLVAVGLFGLSLLVTP